MAIRRMPQRILFILYRTLVLSVIDYAFGLLTLFATHLCHVEVVQNEDVETVFNRNY